MRLYRASSSSVMHCRRLKRWSVICIHVCMYFCHCIKDVQGALGQKCPSARPRAKAGKGASCCRKAHMQFTFWPCPGWQKARTGRMLLFAAIGRAVGKVFSEAQCFWFFFRGGLCQSLVHIVAITVLPYDAESPVTGLKAASTSRS
jgi:hypothetical protein